MKFLVPRAKGLNHKGHEGARRKTLSFGFWSGLQIFADDQLQLLLCGWRNLLAVREDRMR